MKITGKFIEGCFSAMFWFHLGGAFFVAVGNYDAFLLWLLPIYGLALSGFLILTGLHILWMTYGWFAFLFGKNPATLWEIYVLGKRTNEERKER